MSRPLREVAPGVLVATAERWATTSTAVVTDDGSCLLIDPAFTTAELRGLAAALTDRRLRVVLGVATHAHVDHLLWHDDLGEVPRVGSAATSATSRTDLASLRAEAVAEGIPAGLVRPVEPFGRSLPWLGETVRVLEHPAHSPGHVTLLLPARGTAVVGDMLSDREVPLLDLHARDPVDDYRAALDLLEGVVHGLRAVVPGHGSVTDGPGAGARIAADRRYLDALVSGAPVRDGRLGDPWVRREHDRQRAALAGRPGPRCGTEPAP